ncbi:hypothetical protein NMG60_11032624 [Bertholletia excelsa]
MAPSKLQKAIGAVKDQTRIGLAKVSGASLADLEVAIVKATRHEESPADERHVREILCFTHFSQAYVGYCVATISQRLGRTKNWAVAIKCLMLIHRLLVDGDSTCEEEVFNATRQGTRLLNMSDFTDKSRKNSWDYSAFVRTYAAFLDEELEWRMVGRKEGRRRGKERERAIWERREESGMEWRERKERRRGEWGRREESGAEWREREESGAEWREREKRGEWGRRDASEAEWMEREERRRRDERDREKGASREVIGLEWREREERRGEERGRGEWGRRERSRGEWRGRDEREEWKKPEEKRGRRFGGGLLVDVVDEWRRAAMKATPVREMKNEIVFVKMQHLMQLLDRFLACRPRGLTTNSRLVLVALYPVVKASFYIYFDITEILSTLVDRFMGLEVQESLTVLDIFCRISKQFEELNLFYGWCRDAGIARASEYPEVEEIPTKKLETMDEFIREKVSRRSRPVEEAEPEEELKSEEVEEDMSAVKALPPPEGLPEELKEEEKREEAVGANKEEDDSPIVADLLDLGDGAITSEDHGDRLALALFDWDAPVLTGGPTETVAPWDAYKSTENWETALVQSASHLSNQQTSLPGGFNMMMLNGMYQHGAAVQVAASGGYMNSGSASSMAFGSGGRPGVLALPAPPVAARSVAMSNDGDPFAASLPVPPPAYVQMAEMENKQRLLVGEQLVWQQYTMDGMRGQAAYPKSQPHPYPCNMGGRMCPY